MDRLILFGINHWYLKLFISKNFISSEGWKPKGNEIPNISFIFDVTLSI